MISRQIIVFVTVRDFANTLATDCRVWEAHKAEMQDHKSFRIQARGPIVFYIDFLEKDIEETLPEVFLYFFFTFPP